jgi:hypothetical protein
LQFATAIVAPGAGTDPRANGNCGKMRCAGSVRTRIQEVSLVVCATLGSDAAANSAAARQAASGLGRNAHGWNGVIAIVMQAPGIECVCADCA